MTNYFFKTLLVSTFAMFFICCSGKSINDNDPAALFEDAQSDVANDRYLVALDKFKIIRNKFPYSKYSSEAQLRVADVEFLQENFAEAAITYETFRDLHPKHEKAPYAIFRMGLSHMNDRPSTPARDHAATEKALIAFNEFISKHPNHPDAQEAQKNIKLLRDDLANKELYIANFYHRQKATDSARSRYLKIIKQFPDTAASKKAEEIVSKFPPPTPKKSEAEILKEVKAKLNEDY